MNDHSLAPAARYLFEAGELKKVPRTGWLRLGIPLPESVAEHSFRTGVICMILAAIEGADIASTVALGLMHDIHETRVGDVSYVGRAYVKTAAPEAVVADQVAGMPAEVAKAVQQMTIEYEANESAEARLAHDADKIEMLLQAIEYAACGFDTSEFKEPSALQTDAGRRLAQAIDSVDHRWWNSATSEDRKNPACTVRSCLPVKHGINVLSRATR